MIRLFLDAGPFVLILILCALNWYSMNRIESLEERLHRLDGEPPGGPDE